MQDSGKDIRFISYYLGRGRRKTMTVVRGSPEERAILDHNADLRREERHQKKEVSLNQLSDKGYQFSEEEEKDEIESELGILNELLPLITAKQREAFELALFKHLSERKISEILKISKSGSIRDSRRL